MKTYIKLAWRNIWRNKRRTLITMASVFFAVFFALIMRSFQIGSYDNMINNVVEAYTGHIQVHAKGYQDEKTLENTFEITDEILKIVETQDRTKLSAPRLESGALSSSGLQTKFSLITGIDPVMENEMTGLEDKIIKFRFTEKVYEDLRQESFPEEMSDKLKNYRKNSFTSEESMKETFENLWGKDETEKYFELVTDLAAIEGSYFNDPDDDGVLIGERLAKFLQLSVGDTLVIFGGGYHGMTAAGKYPIKGFVYLPNPELDNRIIYMNLSACQELFSAEGRLSSLSIIVDNPDKVILAANDLKADIDSVKYEVMDWMEMNVEMVQQIESDEASGLIMLYLLYVIIGFGVFGTVLMMTAERKKEFGVMVAIGMQKRKLSIILLIELVMLAILGILAGTIGSLPIIRYFVVNPIELSGSMAEMMESYGVEPIMPMAWQIDFFLIQNSIVAVIILIAVLYPLIKVAKINVMNALRH